MQLHSSEEQASITNQEKSLPATSDISPWLINIAYPLFRFLILPLYFREITVVGTDNLPKEGPVLVCPTHRSRWDAFMVPYATGRHITGRNLRFMVTADETTGIQGWFIKRMGGFAVNIKHPAIASLRHGVELLQGRQMMVLFPEGGIFQDNQVHPLKPGLARLAVQAENSTPNLGVKIVPISIRYNPTIPTWRSRVQISLGEPLNVADYCGNSTKKSAQKLTHSLEIALQELDSRNVF